MIRKLLVWHSSYFAAALDPDGSFVSSGADAIHIDDDIATFEAFSCWIYTGRLQDPPGTTITTVEEYREARPWLLSNTRLCQIWIFADMRGIPALKNVAVDMIHWKVGLPGRHLPASIDYVYENTTEGSLLRKLLVEAYAWNVSFVWFLAFDRSLLTIDFVMDLMPFFITRGRDDVPREDEWKVIHRCRWHDHSGPGGSLRMRDRGVEA